MQSLIPQLGYAVILLVAASLVINGVFVAAFARSRKRHPESNPESHSRVLVSMPLRGDSDATPAVESILAQRHELMELCIVVDSEHDAITTSARQAIEGDARAAVHELKERHESCSLVCSAQLQALKLHPSFDGIMAFAAGDTTWHPRWLELLQDGLAEPGVGATLGNRWYVSHEGSWGALTRRHWNAAAVVAMWWLKIPWAGAMAIRTEVIEESNLAETWEHSMVEDVSAVPPLGKLGLKFRHIPDCVAVETGELPLSNVAAFIGRQDLWARLYHPFWPVVLTHALLGVATLLAPILLLVVAGALGNTGWAIGAVGIFAVYVLTLFLQLLILESDINQTLARTGQERQKWSVRAVLRSLVAIPLAQLVHGYVAIRAQFARQVEWSEAHYQIKGPFEVRRSRDDRQTSKAGPTDRRERK